MLLCGMFLLILCPIVANAQDELVCPPVKEGQNGLYVSEELVCPPVKEGMVGACVEACGTGCENGQLCCSNGCGHRCMDGVPKEIDLCCLPAKVGNCKARLERYYFDADTKECKIFYYGGCDANKNNFEKKEDCEKRCLSIDVCSLPAKVGKCKALLERYYFDADTKECKIFFYGGCDANGNNFEKKEDCEKRCLDIDVCSLPAKVGKCKARLERYYFDADTKECKIFFYGGCDANKNNFEKKEDCEKRCSSSSGRSSTIERPDFCNLPAKVGKCKARLERYYFDTDTKECKIFYYGGCDANGNNFEKKEDCEKTCLSGGPNGDVDVTKEEEEKDICNLFQNKGKKKCAEDQLVRYFYNAKTMMCEEFMFSGCGGGNLNNFEDIESCKQSCVACSQPKLIGPCKGAFQRYFYNKETGRCENFLYGGCRGNKNNFISLDQCEMSCKPTCEYYCERCKNGKKLLSRCRDCKQKKVERYTKCAACVMSGNSKFNYDCFNCMK